MSEACLTSVAPQFVVDDIVATATYYRDVLGFEITDTHLDPPTHAVVTRDGAQVFLAQAEGRPGVSNRELKDTGIDAYFRVEGLEALAAELESRDAMITEGPVYRVYDTWEIVIEDCNGFVLVFGEDAQ